MPRKKPNYRMTRQQRQDALVALRACKPYLATSNQDSHPKEKPAQICIAISVATGKRACTPAQDQVACGLISRSLGNCPFYTSWLVRNVHDAPKSWEALSNFAQQQRHRWVDHLIQSLEESLK